MNAPTLPEERLEDERDQALAFAFHLKPRHVGGREAA